MRLAFAFLIACSSSPKPAPAPPAPSAELSKALAPLAWWLGDWQAAAGTEHWLASSGVIFGIALEDDAFEVMIVDDGDGPGKADGRLRLFAMPGGLTETEFSLASQHPTAVTFFAGTKQLTYQRDGEALAATFVEYGKPKAFRFERTTTARADVLEAADRAFAADVAARGIEGWVAAFDPKGGMMTKAGRVEGANAIRDTMKDLLASTKVEWAPIASAVRGDLGYTVGKAVFTAQDGGWKSTYVTIWKKQPDGGWKVLFDTGRTVQASE